MGVILNNKHIVQYLFEVNNTELNGSYVINTQLITDSVEVQHSRVWNIQIGLFNSNGRCDVTLQQSSDNVMWDDMNNATTVRLNQNDSLTFEDSYITGRYIRIIITPTTLTNGNIKAILTEKI